MLGERIVNNILGNKPKADCKSKNMSPELRQEMNTCDECLDLKRQGLIPGVCQYHLNKQFEE